MAETTINKVIFGGKTLIDLTADTVTEATLLADTTAHSKSGEIITGTCTYDADTSDATAVAADILVGKTAYVAGSVTTGTMLYNGEVNGEISDLDTPYQIPVGYHDGSGTVGITADEKAKIIPENIKQGVIILGVEGTHDGLSEEKAQSKTVTPTTAQQTVTPDTQDGYTCLSQVIVEAIPYSEATNDQGGTTVTIG